MTSSKKLILFFVLLFCSSVLGQDLTSVRYEVPYTNCLMLQSLVYKQIGNPIWIETTNILSKRCGSITEQGPSKTKGWVYVDVECEAYMHSIIQGVLNKAWSDMVKTNASKAVVDYKAFTNAVTVVKTNVVAGVEKKEFPPVAVITATDTLVDTKP